jgi:hypothetical protein
MNIVEQEIARASVDQWGHPSWRSRGIIPTYFMTADKQIFCRFFPNPTTGLVSWHWFDAARYGFRQPQLIQGLAHLRILLSTIPQHAPIV